MPPLRPNRRASRPQDTPFYVNPVMMDFEKRSLDLPSSLNPISLSDTLRYQIYYLGTIDGGNLSEPSPAMSDLLEDLDGGSL